MLTPVTLTPGTRVRSLTTRTDLFASPPWDITVASGDCGTVLGRYGTGYIVRFDHDTVTVWGVFRWADEIEPLD